MNISTLNLQAIIEDLFLVLSQKEKDVIVKRFSLDNQPKLTLERIGKSFSVTRERVRQIEKIAINKLRRTAQNTKLAEVFALTRKILERCGGVKIEELLVAEVLNQISSIDNVDANIIKLAFNIIPDIEKVERNQVFRPMWKLNSVEMSVIKKAIDTGISLLNQKGDVMSIEDYLKSTKAELELKKIIVSEQMLMSLIEVDMRFKTIDEMVGLSSWRHINPRSIRDKAYIVLKKAAEPLHFIEIANRIGMAGFDRKMVTTQAVHNELIRYDQFVLVGRGLYALKEWGYKKGTVSDIIEGLLKKKSPLSKQEIILGVLKQRKVKKGTISLNLQKNDKFVRVGRAVYSLKT